MDPNLLWNADGTPRLPDTVRNTDDTPFADLAADELIEAAESTDMLPNVFLSRMRREARANMPAGVGDIVHYWGGGRCLAAIVTVAGDFEDDEEGLYVFTPEKAGTGVTTARHDEGKVAHSWHWPEPQ